MLVDADLRPEATSMNITDVCGSPLADADLPGILKGRFFLPESSKDRNRFFLISAGKKENRNGESVLSIGGQAMTTVRNRIEQLKKWTIYILPPVSNHEASFEALKQIGTAILVVRSGRSSARETEHFVKRMERHGINIISSVITDVPEELTDSGSIDLIKTITDDFKKLWVMIVNLTSIPLAYRQV